MVNISILYPKSEGSHFDIEYYLNKHMPMSIEKLSPAKGFKAVSVERGVDVKEPKIDSTYFAVCHYTFETIEDFLTAFLPNAEELQGDMPNYTNIEPIIQVTEIEISKVASH